MSDPSIDTYLEFIRKQLISSRKTVPGLPASQVHIVENLALPNNGRPEYHFNNLTHNNLPVLLAPELLPPNLRKFVFGNK